MNDGSLGEAMMALHDALDARFLEHQVALLDRDYVRALELLGGYRERLFAHAADEEEHVLPRYAECGGDRSDAPVRLFLGEHANLRRFVDEFVRRVEALAAAPDDRALLELLDKQATFKNLLLHHDLRERNALYPFVGARLSDVEQRDMLARRRWRGEP